MSGERSREKKFILCYKLALPALLLAVAVLVLIRTTMGWMQNQRVLQTIAEIETPFMLDIRGGEEKAIEFLDLNGIDINGEEKVDRIVFCVCGRAIDAYNLELAYTTNNAFQYKIYPAVKADAPTGTFTEVCVDTKNGSSASYYYQAAALTGTKLNEVSGLGAEEGPYYSATYGESFDNQYVQKNAMPIYEIIRDIEYRNPVTDSPEDFTFVDYYVLEVSWKDSAVMTRDKETDMVYLLAENTNSVGSE